MWEVSYSYDNLQVALGTVDTWADVVSMLKAVKRPNDALTQVTITRVVPSDRGDQP
jgi:hypothetical protein